MLETLLGGVFGGVLRLAPEILKLLDRKDERKHELAMQDRELQFAKTQAEVELRKTDAQITTAELDAVISALDNQTQTAVAGGPLTAAISALVRPAVTYLFISIYALVKIASYILAIDQGGSWNQVLVSLWSTEDATILNMILSFWFVGRVYERSSRSG
jgi:hypothetical protein